MTWTRRIYCAGSIAGGREDRSSYELLHRLLGSWGEVLPEALVDENISRSEEEVSSKHIYEQEIGLIRSSDFFVLEASTPSLGAGFQTAEALRAEKPVLVLYRPERPLSAILIGAPLRYEAYRSTSELEAILEHWFEKEHR